MIFPTMYPIIELLRTARPRCCRRFFCVLAPDKYNLEENNRLCETIQPILSDNDSTISRIVPKSVDEFSRQRCLKPVQPTDPRFICVAVLGQPNAGKSTLVNKLTGWRVCSVSSKVHTTRHNTNTVLTIDNTQIVFIDTPGTVSLEHSLKHHIEPTLKSDPYISSREADLIAVLVDISENPIHVCVSRNIKAILQKHLDKHTILILNKTDRVKVRDALFDTARLLCNDMVDGKPFTEKHAPKIDFKNIVNKRINDEKKSEPHTNTKGWSHFKKIFMVSALENKGTEAIIQHLIEMAPRGPWKYHSSVVIDQNPQEIAKMILREKLLDDLPQEMGYVMKLSIDTWKIDDSGTLCVGMIIKCGKKHLVSKVIGSGGTRISKYAELMRQELTNVFHSDVLVKLVVK